MALESFLQGKTRETAIRRDARGKWWNGPDAITHPLLTQAFDSWIDVAEDGRFILKNDINWAYIRVEGAPIFVRSLEADEDSVQLRLSDGRSEALIPATLRQNDEGELFCQVRGGKLAARLDPHAAMQLESRVDEDDEGPYLELQGQRVRPPVVFDGLAWPLVSASS